MKHLYTAAEVAFYDLVHNFRQGKTPSGATALAPLVGMNPKTLSNKVNPHNKTHILSQAEGIALQAATGNREPIKADCATLGGVFTPIPDGFDDISDERVLQIYLELQQEQGETADAVRQALADGKVSHAELKEITREVFEDISKLTQLLQLLTELAQKQN